jgi:predicted acyl esterase
VDGILRLDRIDGVVEAVIDLAGAAIRLERGTRLRLDVSGGNFPEYDRNPNTGEPPFEAAAFRPVRLTVHRGGDRPSRIEAFVLTSSR